MKKRLLTPRSISIITLLLTIATAPAFAQSTAFTYQGQLKDGSSPATGLYDLQFCLFDTPSNPIPLGCATDANDVEFDFGADDGFVADVGAGGGVVL